MGRGKLGGTKAKIRGLVGSEIYQTKRDDNGKLVQHVYKAPESRQYTNTDAQAKARMIMGQIERMFHLLPDIIKYGFDSIPSGTLSFQHFSKMNYPLLKADMTDNWSYNPNFDWRPKYQLTAPAGIWQLTDGVLPAFHYDRGYFSQGENNGLELNWFTDVPNPTIRTLFEACGMQEGDTLVMIFYVKPVDSDEPYIEQINCRLNPKYTLDTELEDLDEDDIFLHNSKWTVNAFYSYYFREMSLDVEWYEPDFDYQAACVAYIIVRPSDSGTKFSSSNFEWLQRDIEYGYRRTTPAVAFYSWKYQ